MDLVLVVFILVQLRTETPPPTLPLDRDPHGHVTCGAC